MQDYKNNQLNYRELSNIFYSLNFLSNFKLLIDLEIYQDSLNF